MGCAELVIVRYPTRPTFLAAGLLPTKEGLHGGSVEQICRIAAVIERAIVRQRGSKSLGVTTRLHNVKLRGLPASVGSELSKFKPVLCCPLAIIPLELM